MFARDILCHLTMVSYANSTASDLHNTWLNTPRVAHSASATLPDVTAILVQKSTHGRLYFLTIIMMICIHPYEAYGLVKNPPPCLIFFLQTNLSNKWAKATPIRQAAYSIECIRSLKISYLKNCNTARTSLVLCSLYNTLYSLMS